MSQLAKATPKGIKKKNMSQRTINMLPTNLLLIELIVQKKNKPSKKLKRFKTLQQLRRRNFKK